MKPIAQHLFEAERDYLIAVLAEAGGSVNQAAKIAGSDRTSFYRRLHRHDLVKSPGSKPSVIVRNWRMAQVN